MTDSFHRSLDAARERAGFAHALGDGTEEYRQVALGHDAPVKPSADVEALGDLVFYGDMDSAASMRSARIIAKHILASDWLAAHTAAARAEALRDAADALPGSGFIHPLSNVPDWLRARADRQAQR